ncbi:hypothetical protein KUTeg_009846 [Tegillarca granosa]|uniref:PiggyBac transposable element-derived protein domain-containing protein n=1 Tax=Tegillarca granosa TaxID=220873 RepID=A0ABQ9F518_TEGGR|nr:hypothetical protein KUTeg_009846 [Tegillarca granosa]
MSPYIIETDTDNVFNIIQTETDRYANQNKNNNNRDNIWQPVTQEEVNALPQNIIIDERMIGFKGRHFMKQYLPDKKANRWGIKAWILAESRTGYSHNIKIYTGKHNAPRHSNGQG